MRPNCEFFSASIKNFNSQLLTNVLTVFSESPKITETFYVLIV